MKAMREAEVTMVNLQLQIYEEKGIKFEVCSVGGHNEHGLVERVIRSLQESMEECGLRNRKLTATGLQTLCKLVENDYNNLPFGFKFDRDQDNTEVLKILTPNMMRHGRINTRALSGPMRLPHGASDMVDRVVKTYEAWYKVWSETYIPKILSRPKWFKNECDLKIGDMVYFEKAESELKSPWILGIISEIERSRDGLIRKVKINYRNASETEDRTTRRSVRNLCKIWSEDDFNLQDDLGELAVRLRTLDGSTVSLDDLLTQLQNCVVHHADIHQVQPLLEGPHPAGPDDKCCCLAHCNISHQGGAALRSYQSLVNIDNCVCELYPKVPNFYQVLMKTMEDETPLIDSSLDNLNDFLLNFNSD